jgi:hypothetical protein
MPSWLAESALMFFEYEDWSLFRTIDGLQQRAGVPKNQLSRLVLKELADNGLDNGATVRVASLPPEDGSYIVEDGGTGIDGGPEAIARLFSINRPMISSKRLRLPTRGALGNGLRVVAGAVLASAGSLAVTTRNQRIGLCPERDGTTTVTSVEAVEFPVGTRVEISFGPTLAYDCNALYWANIACHLAHQGTQYVGKSSPWWYDGAQFHELLYASGPRPVRELIARLDGCSGGKAGEIITAANLERAICRDVTPGQAVELLEAARDAARQVNPKRLGAVGPQAFFSDHAYAIAHGVAHFGPAALPRSQIPFVVEAWVSKRTTEGDTLLTACINRTPATGSLYAARDKRDIDAFGCGLSNTIAKAPSDVQFSIYINVTTPFMPITSDGKAPDLEPFLVEIATAVSKAVRKAHRPQGRVRGLSQKDVVLDNLDDVIDDVSGGRKFRFNSRQILYKMRPIVRGELEQTLELANFTKIIDDYEAENGEIEGMYREPRGSIYHPHIGKTLPLGTLMVETYERPLWTFNKFLYIEKEGFSETLKDPDVRWGERHDCAIASSKGFTTRAARDLVDKLAAHDEPVTVFCVHDADGPGTLIYQTFQEATKARGARKIKIVNLGLEPWEAIEMRLEVERLERKKNKNGEEIRQPVGEYAKENPCDQPEGDWEEWLQSKRVELNAMSTPDFIDWLHKKMADYHEKTGTSDKLIPPGDVLESELDKRVEEKVRAAVTERILCEAGLESQVDAVITEIEKPTSAALAEGIRCLFEQEPAREWRDHIEAVAHKLTHELEGRKR